MNRETARSKQLMFQADALQLLTRVAWKVAGKEHTQDGSGLERSAQRASVGAILR
jgi:hypothetical protein